MFLLVQYSSIMSILTSAQSKSNELRRVPQQANESNLVTVRVTANNNTLGPSRYQSRDVFTDDGFTEHCASEDVPDGAIGGSPHLLQLKL